MSFSTFFTLKFKPISRSKGESCVYKSAYNAGASYVDLRTGEVHNHTAKDDVVETWLEGWDGTPEELWNAAEQAEKTNPRARTAYDFMSTLPNEWTDKQRHDYAKELATQLRDEQGVAVQISLHKGKDWKTGLMQHHVHGMLTTRKVDNNIFDKKKTTTYTAKYASEWYVKKWELEGTTEKFKTGNDAVADLRHKAASLMNENYKKNGYETFVTGGKFIEFMDEDYEPTKPLGKKYNYKGGVDGTYLDKFEYNKQIKTMRDTKKEINKLQGQLKEIEEKMELDKQAQITKAQLEARQQMAKAQIVEKQETAEELVGKDKKFKEELKTQLQKDYDKYMEIGVRVVDLEEQLQECENLLEQGREPLGMFDMQVEHAEKRTIVDRLKEKFKDPQFKEMLEELNLYYIFNDDNDLQSANYTQDDCSIEQKNDDQNDNNNNSM